MATKRAIELDDDFPTSSQQHSDIQVRLAMKWHSQKQTKFDRSESWHQFSTFCANVCFSQSLDFGLTRSVKSSRGREMENYVLMKNWGCTTNSDGEFQWCVCVRDLGLPNHSKIKNTVIAKSKVLYFQNYYTQNQVCILQLGFIWV